MSNSRDRSALLIFAANAKQTHMCSCACCHCLHPAASHDGSLCVSISRDRSIQRLHTAPADHIHACCCFLTPNSLLAGLAASHDGSLCVSISRDRSVKVYDVLGFDMIMMMKLPYTPGTAEWIFKVGSLGLLQYEPCCSMDCTQQGL
jgi:hypothetical protein